MKIKVCGMRDPDNIRELIRLKPDYIGFIFYPQSKRYVQQISKDLLDDIPETIKKTGVFVDHSFDEIVNNIKTYNLNAVQLHGNESPSLCEKLKHKGVEVIKAMGIDESFDFTRLLKYTAVADHFMFDTKTPMHGGSGISFNWELLKKYRYETSYFLSGGIGLENLQQIKEIEDHRLYAVDLNSRFETVPGLKNIMKLEEAINIIRS